VSAAARRPPVWPLIVGATVAAAVAVLLYVGRGTLYTVDDLTWFMTSPQIGPDTLLTPHNGHLIAIPRLIYHLDLEVFGADYAPIRILTALSAAIAAALFFAWTSRRVGRAAALAGTALMLTLGTSYVFLIAGDGIMLQLSLAMGIGSLLALDRGDRGGDAAACALLCLAVLTYSVALPFLVAAGVAIILSRNRRRLWIAAVPAALYAIWWLSTLGDAGDSAGQVDVSNVLSLPSYVFQSLASVLGSVSGLDVDLSDAVAVRPEFDTTSPDAGPFLAVVAIAAFTWWVMRNRPVPKSVWVVLTLPVTLWLMGGLTEDAASPPDATRFVLAFAVVLMMLAAAMAARPPRPGWLAALWVVALCGIAANLVALRDGGDFRRDVDGPLLRSELAAFDLAGHTAVENPDLFHASATGAFLIFPFSGIPVEDPVSHYERAVARYGRLGYTPDELRGEPEELRAHADATLLAARGTALAADASLTAGCAPDKAGKDGAIEVRLPPGGAVLESDAGAAVSLRRFADATWKEVGSLAPGAPAALRIPVDAAPDPWLVRIDAPTAHVCPL
jgi:hypothetical protein